MAWRRGAPFPVSDEGVYSYPAAELSLAKSTLLEHLQKAEAKVILDHEGFI